MALWTPANTATGLLAMWLKGDTLSGVDGSAVSTWPDASGNANNATGQDSPPLSVNSLNGMNTVHTGADSGLQRHFSLPTALLSARTETAGSCTFFVAKSSQYPASSAAGDLNAGGALGDWGSDSLGNHFPYSDGNFYDDYCTTTRKSCGAVTNSSSWHIYALRSKKDRWELWVDGVLAYSTTTNTFGVSSSPRLGRSTYQGQGYLFDGNWAEVVDYADFLSGNSDDDLKRTNGYLAWKWGLQGNLSAGDPYKTAAPTTGPAGPTYTLTVATASVKVAGNGVGLKRARRIAAGVAAVSIAAQPVRLLQARRLGVAVAGVAGAAQPVSLRRSLRLAVAMQPVVVAATPVALTYQRRLAVAPASVVIAGQAVALRWSHRLAVQTAPVAVTANPVTLTKGGAGQLVVSPATVAVAAASVRMVWSRRLTVAPAIVTVGSPLVGLIAARRLIAGVAGVTIAGQPIQLRRGRALSVTPAGIVVDTATVEFRVSRRLRCGSAPVAVMANSVTLTLSGAITLVDSGLATRRFSGSARRTFTGQARGATFR